MHLAIEHTTRYRFAEPVAYALQRLRLMPKETQGQKIVDWTMEAVAGRVPVVAQTGSTSVTEAIESALSAGTPIKLTDDKGRRIIVPANALGYALIGSETKHAVGFGAL